MKEQFIEKRFGAAAEALLEKINDVLETYESQGYELSLRQLYYQLVAANVVANSERSYKNIGNLVSDARLAGLIDWRMIEDRGRTTHENAHWRNPGEIVEAAARGFRIDKWLEQPNHVEVMVEKQALEGVLLPVCQELDIAFSANKGYSSSSALYGMSKRLIEKSSLGKEIHVIYLGDHDPSGIDMTRDIEDRLHLFVRDEFKVNVHRVALNLDQIKKLRPPENPAKLTDSRASDYVRRFGQASWELDAIEPRALAKLVRDKVLSLRSNIDWEAAVAEENKMRAELQRFANKYNK